MVFLAKADKDHLHTCIFARVPKAGTFEENLKQYQAEARLTLVVTIAYPEPPNALESLKPEPGSTDKEVPGLGDRAILQSGANGARLFAASGSNVLILALYGGTIPAKREQDLPILAREALATNFDGWKVTRYEVADRAIASDKSSFEADPRNFAVMLLAMKRFDEARVYTQRAVAANPNDPDVLYDQGAVDWTIAYNLRMDIRASDGLKPTDTMMAGPACTQIRTANKDKVEEGIAALSKAVKLRPDFGDAMAYLNLMYRERADYECDSPTARAADLKAANEWVDKTMAAKKAESGKSPGNALSLFPPIPAPPPMAALLALESWKPGESANPQMVKITEGVSQGLLLQQVRPVYPPLARQARIQGTVVLQVLIGKDGSIESLSLVSGHPMLAPAAMDAVKQWKYKPYSLNGEPVEVETTINVSFELAAAYP